MVLHSALTPRERQVLDLVQHGMTNREIGALLGISPATVHQHMLMVLTRLNLRNRTEAAVWAERHGVW